MDNADTETAAVWGAALGGFGVFLRKHRKGALAVLAAWAIGSTTYGFVKGWAAVMDEALIFACYTVLPVLGVLVLLFLWNLWLAPSRVVLDEVRGLREILAAHGGASVATVPVEAPNLDVWKSVEAAQIIVIAKVCAGEEPYGSAATGREQPFVRLIMQGVEKGEIRRSDGEEKPLRAKRSAKDMPPTKVFYSSLHTLSQVYVLDACKYLSKCGVETEFTKMVLG